MEIALFDYTALITIYVETPNQRFQCILYILLPKIPTYAEHW